MARVYLTNQNGFPIVYTVDQAVGPGCTNQRDDVLLVQFFLKVISESPNNADLKPAGRDPMVCDGICGPNTNAYIKQFQIGSSARNPTSPLKQDGRVDPVRGGAIRGSISHTFYTILDLNVHFEKTRGAGALKDITTDAAFPGELRPSIKIQ